MIRHIEGQLVAVNDGRAHIRTGALTYEVLIPAADQQLLATMIDETVGLHTLHYLEGQGQGSAYTPRLIGFTTEEDRAFFELFTTVKGLGNRKALRALALPFPTVAEAIARKDLDVLKSLPEIGKRTAETIVHELHDKVDRFVEMKPLDRTESPEMAAKAALVRETVAVMAQLGEQRAQARLLVERALLADRTIDSHEALMEAAYRLKDV